MLKVCGWHGAVLTTLVLRTLVLSAVLESAFVLAAETSPTENTASQVARGTVFEDKNANNVRDEGEPGLAGIRVSNGREVTRTDDDGRYELSVDDDTIVFVIKPRNWMTAIDALQLPRFYYIHKPKGSPTGWKHAGVAPTGKLPESIDFGLTSRPEPDTFKVILFGDTQPRNVQEVEYIAHDVVEPIISAEGHDAAFGITLGDVVFDDLAVNQPLIETVSTIGLPWYNVLGNHDMNYDSTGDEQSDETFENTFGPPTYAFDHGPVHFVVIDDVHWTGAHGERRGSYVGRIGAEQLEFIKNDLAQTDPEQLVVLMMHIPVNDVENREELFRLIEDRPHTLSLSAHTHFQEHVFLAEKDGWKGSKPHHHLNHATVCGSWWSGVPDENRIPHATMSDGGPNGYSILTFTGHDYDVDFRAARRPADYQMHIHTPEKVGVANLQDVTVLVNVFAGSERSKVEMQLDHSGTWTTLERTVTQDPYLLEMKEAEAAPEIVALLKVGPDGPNPVIGRKLPNPAKTSHIWKGKLPANLASGLHVIEVRTTDMFGKTYHAQRSVRVVDEAASNP